jgi:hypothetical protein
MQDLIGIGWRLQAARERAMKEAERRELASLAAVFDDFVGDLGGVERALRSLMLSLEHNAASRRSPVVTARILKWNPHHAPRLVSTGHGDSNA